MRKLRQILRFAALLLLVAGIGRSQQPQADYFEFPALSSVATTASHSVGLGGGTSGYTIYHTLQLENIGTPATCTVLLEGCVNDPTDEACWELLSESGGTDCITTKMFHVINRPVRHVRVDLTALTGTAATIKTLVQTLDEIDFASHASWDVTGGFVDSGGDAVYTHTPLQVLTELDFATHANWDVTTGFVDSANNAKYSHAPLEVLDEIDFASHVEWDVTTGFDDSGTNAKYTHTVEEILVELDFATHVEWDVTTGFVDSAGNAVYTHAPLEVLTELDFATHANWTGLGDMTDTTGAAVYTHGVGIGTLTQASGVFASPVAAGISYVFGYAVTSSTGDVACDISTAIASTTTALTLANGAQTTTFTSAGTPGDFVLDCTSNSGGVTIDDVTLKRVDHTATLTQISAAFGNTAVNNVSYVFGYAVTLTTGTPLCDITTAFAATTTPLTMANGSQTTTFTSASSTGDFVILCASDVVGETITFDDVTLTQVNHSATLTQESTSFINPMVAGVGYLFGYTVSSTTGTPVCEITTAIAASATPLTVSDGAQTTTFTSAGTPGHFIISCASDTVGETTTFDDVTLKRSDHTATLTQPSVSFNTVGVDSVSYIFGYTVSSTTGTPLCDITTAFADTTTALTVSDGAQTTIFTSASTTGDFVISCTSDVVGETATFDDVTLLQVNHTATLTQPDTKYANALVASKLYTFFYAVSSVTGSPVCQITSGQTGAAVDLVETNGSKITELTSSATITDDFVISCSSTVVGETITFDDVSWFEQYAKNLNPIAVTTAAAHGFTTGDSVTIINVLGNTNANVTNKPITVVDTTNFTIDGIAGNAPWSSGGTILSDPTITAHYLGVR